MFLVTENNWYNWSYDNQILGKQTGDLEFKTNFNATDVKFKSFREELDLATLSIVEHFGTKIDLFFSGGIDSEIVLRSFLDNKIKPNVYIVRYENDYNLYDVSYAVTICSMLNIDFTIIDFNLQKFYEQEAVHISDIAQIDLTQALPYCKFLEMTDNLPVLADGPLGLYRSHDDYSVKGIWMNQCLEYEIGWSKYAKAIDRQSVIEYFKWTPSLVLSFMNLKWCRNLVNDQYYGKLGINSTKIIGYREAYPDLIQRTKKTGFEKIDGLVKELEQEIKNKNNGFLYRNISKINMRELYDKMSYITYDSK